MAVTDDSGERKHSATNANGAAPAASWHDAPALETMRPEIAERYGLFINGRFVAPKSRRYLPAINPSTGEMICRIAEAGEKDVAAAVEAAKAAQPAWARLKPQERARYLFRLSRRIEDRARELAVLDTIDTGIPIREARNELLPLVARHFFSYAGWCDKLKYAFARREAKPIGVCGAIIDGHLPLLMAAWKLAPALACGNTCVLRPPGDAALTTLRLAELCAEVDLPPGVVNIVTGSDETGEWIARHPKTDKVAFAGSTAAGKRIAETCAEAGTPIALSLGGRNPQIIFEDASIDQAIEGIVRTCFRGLGPVAFAGSRLLVQESILEEVIAKLEDRMRTLRVGDPLDRNTDIGPLRSKDQLAEVERFIETGIAEGTKLHEDEEVSLPRKGYGRRPCFFSNVQPSHAIAREEVDVPVPVVMSFRTPTEAVARANNTPFGLAACVWTDKGSKMFEIARRLKAGTVWCNAPPRFDPTSPFGGCRESGFGRDGGLQGLREYVSL
ncbi:MAG: aldehyde dehydrogenase family protein [Planctomycetota bacterium]|nr:aldehyde dehydrogenase family protein [Planctomycetota bacterium]